MPQLTRQPERAPAHLPGHFPHKTTTRILITAAALLSAAAADYGECAEPARAPNLIVILTDDQGYGDVGVHGNEMIETPRVDRFAAEGVELTRFYTSPVCAPTRASLMTGRYYYRSGVIHTSRGGAKMHGEEVTVAELLSRAGYRTGIFGKWHLGDCYPMRPQDQGFAESLVHRSGGIGQTPDTPNSYFDPLLWHNGKPVQSRGYCTDVFFNAAMDFIEASRDGPFFVYLPTNAPHTPLEVSPKYSDPYKAKGLNDATAKVYGMVTNIDENFGRLLDRLESLGLRDDTVVIFFGDNGPQQNRYNAGLRGRKSSTYEGGIRAACFVQWPGQFAGGRKIDRVAAHLDILPTLTALAGVEQPGSLRLDGVSLLPLLWGTARQWPDRTLYFQCHRGLEPKRYQNCAAVSQTLKMVGYPGTFSQENLDTSGEPVLELYDLATDPGEENDLAQAQPQALARLRAGYEAWFEDVKGTRQFAPGVIHVGSASENPVLLCRYQDGNYRDGVPHGWSVEIEQSGRYRLTINRGELSGPGKMYVSWDGRESSRPLPAGESSAVFELGRGKGVIDVWFVEDGKERVIFSDSSTIGNTEAELLDDPSTGARSIAGARPIAAPYMNEAEAVAAGVELGIGSAELEGPKVVEVLTNQTWTLVYTAGRAGIEPGGGIRVGLRHLLCWERLQNKSPSGNAYFTVKTENDLPVKLHVSGDPKRFFTQHFAWQTMQEVILPERGLAPGETLRLTYGDRSGGGPGVRIQPVDESSFVFKVFVDARGDGCWLPLAQSPSIEIVAAEPHRLSVVMPSDAVVGQKSWCIVRAEDRYGNPATRYRGTVRLQSTDPAARLPVEYRFVETDRGVHRFEAVVFGTPGPHTLSVEGGTFRATGNPVRVARKRPVRLLLWGDLHGHTLFSDGRGTVEEFYDFAQRVAALDFCAVSDHAFELTEAMWEHSKVVTNRVYQPGRFVTFQAYEWSGNATVGGDHNVYFLEDDPPIYRSDNYYDPRNVQMYHGPEPKVPHVTGVFAALAHRPRAGRSLCDKNVFCVPHYGGRHGNPEWHDPKVQRLIEIFSEHRRSEDWATTFLTEGHRLGIIASTDNHLGNPGYGYLRPSYDWDTQEIGMAAVAVYAPERTRESVFRALYDRRTYATSGDRIILDFQADGHPMGSEYRTGSPPVLTVEAVGTARISRVEIKKNSRVVHAVEPQGTAAALRWRDADFQADDPCYYYVRVVQDNDEEAICSPIWVN